MATANRTAASAEALLPATEAEETTLSEVCAHHITVLKLDARAWDTPILSLVFYRLSVKVFLNSSFYN